MTASTQVRVPLDGEDQPRRISRRPTGADRWFERGLTGVGGFVLAVTGAIGVFLGYQLLPTLRRYGSDFLFSTDFDPSRNKLGIFSAIVGTVIVAVIALVIAVPFALAMALFITEYAPTWLRSVLVWVVDLMAAIPSLIFGAWGLFVLMPNLRFVARWLATWLGWIPIFDIPGVDVRSPTYPQSRFVQSPFIAGCIVALMVIPLACSVMRNVFSQAPVGEREAAFALGATRWGVIRSVVLPFGRGGIVGGIMLGLGRALGETIAVVFILQESFQLKVSITDHGGVTISQLVAIGFGSATAGAQLNALVAAGFVLFLMTLAVNTGAAVVVSRSRSGVGVDA